MLASSLCVVFGIWLVQAVQFGHAQGLFQVVQRALRLRVLLIQQVVEDVFVSLDQALRVLLSVLKLLVSVSLNAFEQSCKCKLL